MRRYVPKHGKPSIDKGAEPAQAVEGAQEPQGGAPPPQEQASAPRPIPSGQSPTPHTEDPAGQPAGAPPATTPSSAPPQGASSEAPALPGGQGTQEEYEEPIPAPVSEPQPRKHSRKRIIVAGLVFGVGIIAVIAAALFLVRGLPTGPEKHPSVIVSIPRGLNAQQIGEILSKKRVISSPFAFKVYAELNGVSDKLQPGTYRLHEEMQYKDVATILARGPKKEPTAEVVIPEGFTLRQVAARVAADTGLSQRELLVLAGSQGKTFRYEFLQSNPTGSLEGYMFPKTYGIPKSADERRVIERMLSQFQRETAHLDWARAQKRGLTLHQVVTIASLIEREAKVGSERPLISAVIANRLRKGIALRIDATVQYGLPEWKEQLTYEDLKIDSPYNTYLHQGLPPGPIANPGTASIKAALNPAKVGYLYYVLTDSRGKHTFTNTYGEFLRAKAAAKTR